MNLIHNVAICLRLLGRFLAVMIYLCLIKTVSSLTKEKR